MSTAINSNNVQTMKYHASSPRCCQVVCLLMSSVTDIFYRLVSSIPLTDGVLTAHNNALYKVFILVTLAPNVDKFNSFQGLQLLHVQGPTRIFVQVPCDI